MQIKAINRYIFGAILVFLGLIPAETQAQVFGPEQLISDQAGGVVRGGRGSGRGPGPRRGLS